MGGLRRWYACAIVAAVSLVFPTAAAHADQEPAERVEPVGRALEGEAEVLDVGALQEALESQDAPVVLDVRSREAWDMGHIAGAVHLPLDELSARLAEVPRDRRVVAYCSCPAEESSLEAAHLLLAAGFERVAVLLGGFERWRDSGGEVRIERSWEEIHAVGAPPRGWAKTPSEDFEYALDEEVVFQGRRSARVTGVNAGQQSSASLAQVLDATGYRGRRVRLEAALRAREVANAAILWLRAESASGEVLAFRSTKDAPLNGTLDWQRYTLTTEVPGAAAKLAVGLTMLGPGTLWVDDVDLVADGEGPEDASPGDRLVNPVFEE